MKEQLRIILTHGRLDEIAGLAQGSRRILSALTALTYEPDPLIAWRAVEAIGIAAEVIADADAARVTVHLRRLHWLLSDESGGICWYSPQAMAEIVRRRPELFSDFIPLIVSLLITMEEEDLDHFRPAVLWAIGRLAPAAGGALDGIIPALAACLDHPDPQVRGLAAWCFIQAGKRELTDGREDLRNDEGPVTLYRDGSLVTTTVRRVMSGADQR